MITLKDSPLRNTFPKENPHSYSYSISHFMSFIFSTDIFVVITSVDVSTIDFSAMSLCGSDI